MRKYVTVHPEYTDMDEWRGRETSDIEYWDVQRKLTTELIEKSYLDRDTWEGKQPSYFIEVKTTTGPCETPFYISKAQYQRVSVDKPVLGARRRYQSVYKLRGPRLTYRRYKITSMGPTQAVISISSSECIG